MSCMLLTCPEATCVLLKSRSTENIYIMQMAKYSFNCNQTVLVIFRAPTLDCLSRDAHSCGPNSGCSIISVAKYERFLAETGQISDSDCDCGVPCFRHTYQPTMSFAHLSQFNIERLVLVQPETRRRYVVVYTHVRPCHRLMVANPVQTLMC